MPQLTIEMVPEPLCGVSLANLMPPAKWDDVRKSVYRDCEYHCGICGVSNTILNCHEIWHYNDDTNVQTLTGFVALCQMCHHVKHLGRAGILASQGKLDINLVGAHFCKVNDCTWEDYERLQADAGAEWRERSKHAWTSDLGDYAYLLPDFQERAEAQKTGSH